MLRGTGNTVRRIILAVATATTLLTGLLAAPAQATYVGGEGRLAFVRSNQVYTVAKSGGTVKQLTTAGKNYRPKWSPNGKRIAYINETSGGAKNLWVMSVTGANKAKITTSGTVSTNPTWSPDGKNIAFAQDVQGDCDPGFLCPVARLFTVKSSAPFGAPTMMLGYETCEGTISAGCSDQTPAEAGPINVDRFLAWSPDGSRIALFNHSDGQFDDAIWMYYVATGEEKQFLVFGADCCGYADFTDLAWGPTGQFGLGDNLDEGFLEGGNSRTVEKLVYPADQCRIYREFASCPTPPGPIFVAKAGDKSPAPSPTNAHMAFVNATGGTSKIYTATSTGKQRKLIVTNGYQPDWQPRP